MIKKLNLASSIFLFLGLSLVSAPAIAQQLYVSRNVMGPYGQNFYSGGALGDYPSDYNGQMRITANAGNTLSSPLFVANIWCIDQLGFIGLGDNPNIDNTSGIVYDVLPLSSFTSTKVPGGGLIVTTTKQAHQIAALAYIGDNLIADTASFFPIDLSVYTKNEIGNAVQAAITNIQYGTASNGGTNVNTVTTILENWVTAIPDSQLYKYNANVYFAYGDIEQRIISVPGPLPILGVYALFSSSRNIRKKIRVNRGTISAN
jgi:hypothetical protein